MTGGDDLCRLAATSCPVSRPLPSLLDALYPHHTWSMARVFELHRTHRVNGPWTIQTRRGSVRSTSRLIQTDETRHMQGSSFVPRPICDPTRPWGVPTVAPGRPRLFPFQIRRTTFSLRGQNLSMTRTSSSIPATSTHLDKSCRPSRHVGHAYVEHAQRSCGMGTRGSGEAAEGGGLLPNTRNACRWMHMDTREGRLGGGRHPPFCFDGQLHGIDGTAWTIRNATFFVSRRYVLDVPTTTPLHTVPPPCAPHHLMSSTWLHHPSASSWILGFLPFLLEMCWTSRAFQHKPSQRCSSCGMMRCLLR